MSSWLAGITEIASKAEQLLESVDQAAAKQLHMTAPADVSSASRGHFDDNNAQRSARLSSNISNNDLLSSESLSQVNSTSALHDSTSRPEHPSALAASSRRSASSSAQSSAPASNKNTSEKIDLMDFLNSGTKDNTGPSRPKSHVKSSSNVAVAARDDTAAISKSSAQSERAGDAAAENAILRNEVALLTDEISSLTTKMRANQELVPELRKSIALSEKREKQLSSECRELRAHEQDLVDRLKSSERDLSTARARVSESEALVRKLESEKRSAIQGMSINSEAQSMAVTQAKEEIAKLSKLLMESQEKAESSQLSSDEKISSFQTQLESAQKSIFQLQQQVDESKVALSEQLSISNTRTSALETVQREFLDYKQRAAKILQTKEKIISEMRTSGGVPNADGSNVDLMQFQSERDTLQEQLSEAHATADQLRGEIQEMERRQQSDADLADAQFRELEQALDSERTSRKNIEIDLQSQQQITLGMKDELQRNRQVLQTTIKEREEEVQTLRAHLTQKSISSSSQVELESKMRALTETLLQKQSQLEALTADRSSLALQLETEKRRRDEAITASIVKVDIPLRSDADDGSRMKPITSIISGNLGDRRFTRQIAIAANGLDAFSVRLGVFLRRYPMARIMVILYMGILHLWVLLVLFTYTPDVRAVAPANKDLHH